MKKNYNLFLIALFIAAISNAQTGNINLSGENLIPFERNTNQSQQADTRSQTSEWYNYGQSIYDLGGNVSYFRNYLFPDSTVSFDVSGTMNAVWKHSLGQVLDPASSNFFNNTILDSTIAYSLDSVRFWYRYFRIQNGAPDTLVIQIYNHNHITFAPDPWGTGVPYARAAYSYVTRKGSSADYEYTILLTDNDTAMGAQRELVLPVNVNVAAGKKIAATITYFPGNPFNVGDTIDAYMSPPPYNQINAFIAYDFRDNDKTVDVLKYNNALTASKEVRYNISTNGWNGKYIPGTAWNAGFYHLDMDFKITTNPISVREIDSPFGLISVYPNPAVSGNPIHISIARSPGNIKTKIIDMTGRVISGENHPDAFSGKQTLTINAENISAGMYLLRIEGAKESASLQLCIIE